MQMIIEPNGSARCIYDEALKLHRLGRTTITRGSYVEPTSDGQWTADLAPVNGPLLGPFRFRSQALEAEIHWLISQWLCPPLG